MCFNHWKRTEHAASAIFVLFQQELPFRRNHQPKVDFSQLFFHVFNSTILKMFYFRIQFAKEAGILEKIARDWTPMAKAARCMNRQISRPELIPLSLYDLSSAFIVLGVGIIVTSLIFIFERVRKLYSRSS